MNFLLPKAMVFDWDNTLVDSWPAIADAINQTRARFGISTWSLAEIQKNCTRAARDSFPEWFGDTWKEAYDFYYQSFDELRRNREITIKNGADILLQWLQEQNIPAFVVSNKRGDFLRHEIERLKWQAYFVGVVGAQDAPKDKPAREHVDYALNYGNLIAHPDIWFVGDSEADIECARNSGCTPVYIGSRKEADKLGVKLVFSDCQELQTLLYNVSNNNKNKEHLK